MGPDWRKTTRVVGTLVVVVGMITVLIAYSPTLYWRFRAASGYGEAQQRTERINSVVVSDRAVTVCFDTNVAPDLPWRFEPVRREVQVRLGEQKLVSFTAENLTDHPTEGRAAVHATPANVGRYFKNIQCPCFDDQRLDAHQKVDMPVALFIDPALAKDPNADDVSTITLSYTFFRKTEPSKAPYLSRPTALAEPDPHRGQDLFVQRCAACHALDDNKAGPMLGGVFGRKAGSVPSYNYSPVLRNSGLIWSTDSLDRWLADPRGFVPGSRMPIKILDPIMRGDIISYLKEESRNSVSMPPNATVAPKRCDNHH